MADDTNTAEREAAEQWLRDRYGAYRGHFAWRELEEAFLAGRASLAASAGSNEGSSEGSGPVAQLAAERDELFQAAIDFIRTLTGMEPPPIEVAPPEVFAPFREFVNTVQAITDKRHPSPPEGMAGWKPIATAPKDRLVDILNAGRRYAGCHYDRICGEYRHVTACGVLIRLKNATHWMPAPPLPASEAKEL